MLDRYSEDLFQNEVLYLGSERNKIEAYKDYPLYFRNLDRINYKEVCDFLKRFNGIVFYGLNYHFIKIVNRLPKDIKLFWRFSGSELYAKYDCNYLSERTKAIGGFCREAPHPKQKFSVTIKKLKTEVNYRRAKNRISRIIMTSKEEYDELCLMSSLPKLMLTPISKIYRQQAFQSYPKQNKIILGNSRSPFNNHIDIVDYIAEENRKLKAELILFFNYGARNEYSRELLNSIKTIENHRVIEEFLPMDDFIGIYREARALVINSTRQLALGNIFTAISCGCKVYLNEKNSTYKWLTGEGIKLFTIEDLKKDIKEENFVLDENTARNNDLKIRQLNSEERFSEFNKELYLILAS